MKKIIGISTFILLTFVSCDNSRIKESQEHKQETPKALQQESSFEKVSIRGNEDIMENLYSELVTKTPELKELESKLNSLSSSKSDSTELFDRYNSKNQIYYNSADNHIKQINDSILRKKMKSMISSSLTKYKSKIYQHSELLKSIDKRTMTLDDLHEILMITMTLPLIEKYQNANLPTNKSINGYSKQLDKALYIENALLEKNNIKGKTE